MKLRTLIMLSLILPTLSACASKASGIDLTNDWCMHDKFMCKSHQDTVETQAEVDKHNIDFLAACPKAHATCK